MSMTISDKPKLISERRFGDARALMGEIQTLLTIADIKYCYVKTFSSDTGYAGIARLWEGTLTDGSKVYELHLL